MSEEAEYVAVGACGKKLTSGSCFPNFIDDLCASCPYNGWLSDEAEEFDDRWDWEEPLEEAEVIES